MEPTLHKDSTIRDAVKAIEETRKFIAAVVDTDGILLGAVSDGDIRRAILDGKGLDSIVSDIMSTNPITANVSQTNEELKMLFVSTGVAAMPIVDDASRFVRIAQINDLEQHHEDTVDGGGFKVAVIMAGGEGKRLHPLTANIPKPMIEVGDVPLLELLVRRLAQAGIRRIYIATNYLGHIIEDHFFDGKDFGVDIRYLKEEEKLGTAGALSLLNEKPDGPLLVINGDVVTTSDFNHLYHYHNQQNAFMTVGAVEYNIDIPFGVILMDGARASGVAEKPSQRFFCNAGIYAVSHAAFDKIPKNTYFDMTSLMDIGFESGEEVAVFPIHEYWTDIGNPQDLEKARRQFLKQKEHG